VVEAIANSDNYAVYFLIDAWDSLNKYCYTLVLPLEITKKGQIKKIKST
jgi:hypothetical protein